MKIKTEHIISRNGRYTWLSELFLQLLTGFRFAVDSCTPLNPCYHWFSFLRGSSSNAEGQRYLTEDFNRVRFSSFTCSLNRFSRNRLAVLFLLFSILPASAQQTRQLTLLFAGDIMGHDTQIESARRMGNGVFDYTSCFRYIAPMVTAADIAVGNLEVTLAGPPYKGYPQFSSPDALAEAIRTAGFDILVQANNHAVDRGKEGLERTLCVLDSLGLVRSGVFKDDLERRVRYPLIVEKNGVRLALLNYTYSTNGIGVAPPNIVNMIDTAIILQDLQKAATAEPDFTIALMHWGTEYQLMESSAQQQLARFLFHNGTDAIIGSHPHVVQPIRELEGKLVVYSLGNMISNQRNRYTDGGILFQMTLQKRDSTTVTSYGYTPVWVHKRKTIKGTDFCLVPAAVDTMRYNDLGINAEDAKTMQLFLQDTRKNLQGIPEIEPSNLQIE